jgi:hypothetical protein
MIYDSFSEWILVMKVEDLLHHIDFSTVSYEIHSHDLTITINLPTRWQRIRCHLITLNCGLQCLKKFIHKTHLGP